MLWGRSVESDGYGYWGECCQIAYADATAAINALTIVAALTLMVFMARFSHFLCRVFVNNRL
jgi:hypothetical protein